MKVITIRPDGSRRVVTRNDEPTRTQQQFKDQVNVNNIMARYRRTGTIDHIRNVQEGAYADLSDLPDYQDALNTVIVAQSTFNNVPSDIRARFQNDPKQFIDFVSNPANKDELIKLGLANKPAPKTPAPTPETTPADPPKKGSAPVDK